MSKREVFSLNAELAFYHAWLPFAAHLKILLYEHTTIHMYSIYGL
jgi:hypothetical protein